MDEKFNTPQLSKQANTGRRSQASTDQLYTNAATAVIDLTGTTSISNLVSSPRPQVQTTKDGKPVIDLTDDYSNPCYNATTERKAARIKSGRSKATNREVRVPTQPTQRTPQQKPGPAPPANPRNPRQRTSPEEDEFRDDLLDGEEAQRLMIQLTDRVSAQVTKSASQRGAPPPSSYTAQPARSSTIATGSRTDMRKTEAKLGSRCPVCRTGKRVYKLEKKKGVHYNGGRPVMRCDNASCSYLEELE